MAQTNRTTRAFVLFLIQPFAGFIASLKVMDTRIGKFIFITFCTLWGYAQSFTYTSADVYRLGATFCQHGIYDFSAIISMFAEGRAVDGYLLVVNYLVHQFSNNAKVYFAFLGLIYGWFCYSVLASLIKETTNGSSKQLVHILVLLFATASFANLSMPRYWTAAWISALVFLKITQGKKRWVWGAIVLSLIHFSFVPIAVALIAIALANNSLSNIPKVLFWAVLVMFLLSFVMPETVIARLLPEDMINENAKLASKYGYVSGEGGDDMVLKEVSAYREANGIVTRLFHFLMKTGSFFLLVYFHLRRNTIRNDKKVWITYISALCVAFVAYFMSIIPSTGWRYINVLWLYLYILLYRYYDLFRPNKFQNLTLGLYAMNIYTISFMFYVTYRTVDLLLFYAPLPIVIIHGIGFPPVYFV